MSIRPMESHPLAQALPFGEGRRARVGRHRFWRIGSPLHWAAVDAVCAGASMAGAYHLTPGNVSISETHAQIWLATAANAVFAFFLSYAIGLNTFRKKQHRWEIIVAVLAHAALVVGCTLTFCSLVVYRQIGRYILVISTLLLFALEAAIRFTLASMASKEVHNLALFGDDAPISKLKGMLEIAPFRNAIVSEVRPGADQLRELSEAVENGVAHEVVVHGNLAPATSAALLSALDRGITVSRCAEFSERHFLRVPVEFVDSEWFFAINLHFHHPFYSGIKRCLDIVAAVGLGLVALPIVALAAIAVRLESKGPSFYSQIRTGLNQKPFRIWKLRTMRVDAERSGAQWAKVGDSRVTRVGRILRLTRIDELPQFWNILWGEMAFVGPRPERPEFVETLAAVIPFYRQRHLTKPGLTGWAQICYPYGASVEDAQAKLSYDLYYLRNGSFLLDFQIILQTIGAVTKGAR